MRQIYANLRIKSHWPCITDLLVYPPMGSAQWPRASRLRSVWVSPPVDSLHNSVRWLGLQLLPQPSALSPGRHGDSNVCPVVTGIMAVNGLSCADVPLRNTTHSLNSLMDW